MADIIGQHEISDNQGSSVVYGGPAGTGLAISDITTTEQNIPAVADKVIAGFIVKALTKTLAENLLISADSGTSWFQLSKADEKFFTCNVLGEITQLKAKTDSGTIAKEDVQFLLNFEPQ